MSNGTITGAGNPGRTIDTVRAGLDRRYRAERRFRIYGLSAIVLGLLFVSILFITIIGNGYPAFQQTYVKLDIDFDPESLGIGDQRSNAALSGANYQALVRNALKVRFPDVTGRSDRRALNSLISSGASYQLRDAVLDDPTIIGTRRSVWVPADDDVDQLVKGHMDRAAAEGDRRLKDNQLAWLDQLQADGAIEKRFNTTFFTAGDSREPELAGIRGALMGSVFTLIVTLALSFPIGVATAVYLEEFAPHHTDLLVRVDSGKRLNRSLTAGAQMSSEQTGIKRI